MVSVFKTKNIKDIKLIIIEDTILLLHKNKMIENLSLLNNYINYIYTINYFKIIKIT